MLHLKFESLADQGTWLKGIVHLKNEDPVLATIIDKIDYPEFKIENDYYGSLVETIIYQQLAGSAANAIFKRFKDLYEGKVPKPHEYLSTTEDKLRSAGISPQKYSYIKDLCERLEKGILNFEALPDLPNEDVVRVLDTVKGIGRWTAEMFLIFSLGRTNVLPADDLGLRKAVQKAYKLKNLPDKKKLSVLSQRWKPYSSVATLYLWRSFTIPDPDLKS